MKPFVFDLGVGVGLTSASDAWTVKGIWEVHWRLLWRSQRIDALRRLAQFRFEAADTKPDQRRLHTVDDPGTFANQTFALTARAPGVFLLEGWDRHHFAVSGLAAQPSKENTYEHLSVETICLCPAVLARHCHTRRMNDVGLNVPGAKPPRLFGQPGVSELIYLVGHYCFVSMTLNGFDVPAPDGS
jgi:hypothetical protein